jgi:hypothetical protein
VEIPEVMRQAVDGAVRRSLFTELHARGLLLTGGASESATARARSRGQVLLGSVVAHCYQDSAPVTKVQFDNDDTASRMGLALAFGTVSADLLMRPTPVDGGKRDSLTSLCATFNLGIGLVDGLCDGAPHLGRPFLDALDAADIPGAALEPRPRAWLRSALPAVVATDPTVDFTARVIEAFFNRFHSAYPGAAAAMLRAAVAVLLRDALDAESQSVGRSKEAVTRDRLIESSRRTSVVPFQIIEHLANGDHELREPSAGTLIGEALWRIDDLVDVCDDVCRGALNAVALTVGEGPSPPTLSGVVAVLADVLSSDVIPVSAATAAENLNIGLNMSWGGGPPTSEGRQLLLSYVQRYARIDGLEDRP